MEENYIVLNKWDIEDPIGNSGCAVVDDKQYYRDEIKNSQCFGLYPRMLLCIL